ncbi:MAG: hypothetical protein H6835_20440, partial [Planctomycetes bacterium]|nr:hypothetical protein [Planctomycetota bacterium]
MLGLLLLALGTALGLALQWPPSTPQRPAPPPAGGAQGGADAADGDFHRGETTPGPSATNDGTATVRLAMPDEAQAAASRTLEVRVVARRPDGGIVRVPVVDVALEVDQD